MCSYMHTAAEGSCAAHTTMVKSWKMFNWNFNPAAIQLGKHIHTLKNWTKINSKHRRKVLCWVALAHNGNPLLKQQQQPQPALTKNITAKEAAQSQRLSRTCSVVNFCVSISSKCMCVWKILVYVAVNNTHKNTLYIVM